MTFHPSAANKQPGEVYCIGMIRKLVEAGQDDAISAALAALRAVPALDRPVFFSDYVLAPWIRAVAETRCFHTPVLARALELQNPFKVIERARDNPGRTVPAHIAARLTFIRLIREALAGGRA